jgi:hypothetical protein
MDDTANANAIATAARSIQERPGIDIRIQALSEAVRWGSSDQNSHPADMIVKAAKQFEDFLKGDDDDPERTPGIA